MNFYKILIINGLLFFLNCFKVSAQCAMCRATIENSASEGSNLAEGLNTGILYLASMPYLAFTAIVYFLYRESKKNARIKQNSSYLES